jgi:hypothetical protein
MKQTIWTPSEIEIMKRALPTIDAVPAPQDECWPGDAGHDECQLRDHAASLAAVAATAGVSWEFGGWARTARMFRDAVDDQCFLDASAADVDDALGPEE